MNEQAITQSILSSNIYLTLSTVCEDGSPRGTPVHFAYDNEDIYWFSFDETVHSLNIVRDPRIFITIFSSSQNPEGTEERAALYAATTARRLDGEEERVAQDIFADRIEDDRHLGENAHFYHASLGEFDTQKSNAKRLYYRNTAEAPA